MLNFRSFSEIKAALQGKECTLPNIVEHYLSNIVNRSNLNAFIEVFEDEAREKARFIQEKIESGSGGKLAGMVLGIKDNISYKKHGLSAGSASLDAYNAPYNATAIDCLVDEDAIILGRLNCDEFGMGGSNENSAYGPCLNPHDEKKVAGGSSGGSAAAIAADLCHASLGSDTGGSVRQPASFCGVVGMKPTYGQISRHGLVAYASSFDQIGPMTRSVEDAQLLFEVMSSTCEFDATSNPETESAGSDDQFKFAVIKESFGDQTQEDIQKGLNELIVELRENGHAVEILEFPLIDFIVPAYYVLTMAEASSNLSRYDGIQFGTRAHSQKDLIDMIKETRSAGFGQEVKRRIMMGNFVLSQEFAEAYYNKAQKVRQLIKRETEDILKNYDFIVTPTAPTTAFDLGAKDNDPLTMYLMDIFTVQANLCGLPALSLPLFKDQQGMPYGIQFLSGKNTEQKLFKLGKYLYH